MSYPRCIITVNTISPSTLELKFSHPNYAGLYVKILKDKIKNKGNCTYEYDSSNKRVNMQFAITWTTMGEDFVFINEEDAADWENMVGLCITTITPERKRIMKELEWTVFKKKLGISQAQWAEFWATAVDAPRVQQTPQNQLPITTSAVPAGAIRNTDQVTLPDGRIRRIVYRLGPRLGIRVRMPKVSRNKNKVQNLA